MDCSRLRGGIAVIRCLALLLATAVVAAPVVAAPTSPPPAASHAKPAEVRAFTADDLVRIRRVTDPEVSPDGRYVAFVMRETDMEANRGRTDIWLLDLGQKNATPLRLTQSEANDSSPRWAPDSRTIYFL